MDFKSIVSAYSTISAYCGGGWIWTNIFWDQQTSYLDDTPICMRIFTIAVSIRIFRLLHKCGVDMQCWNFNQPTERYLYRINRKNLITVFPVVSILLERIFSVHEVCWRRSCRPLIMVYLALLSIMSQLLSVCIPSGFTDGIYPAIILVRYSTNKSQFIISPILDKDNMAFVQQMIPIFMDLKVELVGIEPTTHRLWVCRSDQLS